MLTDRNVGSVTRTLGEAFARELAVLRTQLEMIYRSGFVDTAEGTSLDMVVALLGVTRKARDFAVGGVRFYRDVPAPADIFVPEGTRVSTALALPAPDGGPPRPVSFVTTADRTLARGQLSVEAPVRAEEQGPRGVVDGGAIALIDQTVLGIAGVVNDAPTVFGAAGESDDELRRRAKTVAERAGRATPRALTNALTGIGPIRENDVKIVEQLGLRPGVVEVFVAADPTAQLAVSVEQAILATRAAGHPRRAQPADLPALRDAADRVDGRGARGAGRRRRRPRDRERLPLPGRGRQSRSSRRTRASRAPRRTRSRPPSSPRSRATSRRPRWATCSSTTASARTSWPSHGVYDSVLDIAPVPEVPQAPVAGKRNIVLPEGRRAVIDAAAIRVTFAGAPLSFDFQITVTPQGGSGLDAIRGELRARLTAYFAAPGPVVDAGALVSLLGVSDLYTLGVVAWTAEYEQAGLVIREAGGAAAATPIPEGTRPVLRDVAVREATA